MKNENGLMKWLWNDIKINENEDGVNKNEYGMQMRNCNRQNEDAMRNNMKINDTRRWNDMKRCNWTFWDSKAT